MELWNLECRKMRQKIIRSRTFLYKFSLFIRISKSLLNTKSLFPHWWSSDIWNAGKCDKRLLDQGHFDINFRYSFGNLFQRDFSIFHSSTTTRFIHLVAPKFYPLFCVYKYLGKYLCLLLNGRRNSWKPYLAHMWAATSSLSAFEQLQKWKLHINSINQCYTIEQHFVTALL